MTDTPPSSTKHGAGTAANSQAAALEIGTVISDRYLLVDVLATGGMGAVYKAEHLLLRKWVAVKLLHHQTRNLPEQVLRFEREAIAGAHLQHPNIASATDFGKLPDGSFFLVLEYVRGIPLEEIIQRGAVPAARTVKIARQVAGAIAAAHERGVIHRDVKPHNIMVDPAQGDLVKLIDFGLAKVPLERFETTDRDPKGRGIHRAITQRDMVFGTVAYMAPESAGGMEKVDERSDLYALGIVLYEMLAGRHPFDATERRELFRQQISTPPPPLKLRAPGVEVPRELEAVVMRLLRKEPAERYESARAVIAALDDAMPMLTGRVGSSPGIGEWRDALAGQGGGLLAADAGRGAHPELDDDGSPVVASPVMASPVIASKAVASKAVAPKGVASQAVTLPAVPAPGLSPPQIASTQAAPPQGARPPRPTGSSVFGWIEVRRKRQRFWVIGAGVVLAAGAIAVAAVVLGSLRSADLPPGVPEVVDTSAAAPPPASAASAGAAAQDRERLLSAAKYKEFSSGEEALIRMLQADPAAFRDREVQKAAAAIAVKIAFRTDARADQVFEALEKKLGEGGFDVLYEMVSAHGDSKGAERAMAILKRPEVLGRLAPPLKIAVELREASCKQKPALFDRAGREGDERVTVVLQLLRSPECKPKIGQCCFREDPALERALTALRARLKPRL